MTNAEFNVVVPIFNTDPALVELALRSVEVAATEVDFPVEVSMIDDGSSGQLAAAYERLARARAIPVSLKTLDSNRGIAAARNVGVSRSAARWHVLLDSDDSLAPNFFKSVRDALPNGTRFAFTDHRKVSYAGETIETRRKSEYFKLLRQSAGTIQDPFLHFTFLIHCHVIHREVFRRVGLFNETIRFGDEIDFHLRCTNELRASEFAHVPEVLYTYRDNPDGVCNDNAKYTELIATIERLLLSESQRRGASVTSCWRAEKLADGAVAYEYR